MYSITFNGIRKSYIYLLEGRQKAPFNPISRNITETKKGHRLKQSKRGLLPISLPVGFFIEDDEHALQISDELAGWLITKDIAPLQLDDEPGRTYWCVVENSLDDFQRMVSFGRGTIQFLSFYTTGESKEINITTSENLHLITGQASTPWKLEVEFEEATERFEAWFGDNYLQLNYNFSEGDRLVVEYTGRKVFLNGNDLRVAVSLSSNFAELQQGYVELRASHASVLTYVERYY